MLGPSLRSLAVASAIVLAIPLIDAAWLAGPAAGRLVKPLRGEPLTVSNASCGQRDATAVQQPPFDWTRVLIEKDLIDGDALSYISKREAADSTYRIVRGRAAASLRARGFQPTDDARVVTLRVPRKDIAPLVMGLGERVLSWVVPKASAEEYEGYEIIAESWDDGDDSTWEGNVYVRNLTSGYWASSNEQQWLQSEPYVSNWAQNVSTNLPAPQYRCRKTGSPCGYCGDASVWRCNLDRGLDDAWPWCVGGAAGCVLSGPLWLKCASVNCYGQVFSRWLNVTKQHFQNCWLDEDERIACGG